MILKLAKAKGILHGYFIEGNSEKLCHGIRSENEK